MQLPYEVFEYILQFCDGETLMIAETVCKDWKNIIEYLGHRKGFWESRCYDNIPQEDFLSIKEKVCVSSNNWKKWEILFRNWYSWKKTNANQVNVVELKALDMKDPKESKFAITCVKMSGQYVVYSTENGEFVILDETGEKVFSWLYYNVPVSHLAFFNEKLNYNDEGFKHEYLLAAYSNTIILIRLHANFSHEIVAHFRDVECFSYYMDFLCFTQRGGHVQVKRVCAVAVDRIGIAEGEGFGDRPARTQAVCYARFYSPREVLALDMYAGKVVIIARGQLYSFRYDSPDPIVSIVVEHPLDLVCYGRFWIFCHQIIFNLVNTELQIMSMDEERIDKVYDCMTILGGIPYCMMLHGPTLFIGTSFGSIFLYHVGDWCKFDLGAYYQKIYVQGGKVHSLDVVEIENQHILSAGCTSAISYVSIDV